MIKHRLLLITSIFLGIALVLPVAPTAKADPLGTLTQYSPPSAGPTWTSMVEGYDGNIWVAKKNPKSIFVMSKSGAVLSTHSLPSSITEVTSMSRGPDGNIWFTNAYSTYGKISPSGNVDIYTLPAGQGGDLSNIVSGSDGYLYMGYLGTASGGAQRGFMSKINVAGQLVQAYSVGTPTSIYSMTVDYADGAIWALGARLIHKLDITTGNVATYPIPGTHNSSGGGITTGPDGRPWFVLRSNYVGSINLDGTFSTMYALPIWYQSNPDSIVSGLDGNLWVSGYQSNSIVRITTSGTVNTFSAGGGTPRGIISTSDGNVWFRNGVVNKLAKMGTGVTGSMSDIDYDGLNASQEYIQGTSDFTADTDKDGLNDYVESTSYPDRDNVFCGAACAYPSPTMKDLYVEIDWMVNGSFSTKPTYSDLVGPALAYGNRNIKFHFDTGNFGGGNEVDYVNVVKGEPDDTARDFYDYKLGGDGISAQFSSDRYHIWRYMLSADELTNFDNETNLVGLGIPGDDDALLGYGRLSANHSGSTLEAEVGQTVIHEIGHNLCLSNAVAYIGQDSSCVYEHIDSNSAPSAYASAMKYNGTVLDLSMGTNPSGDHDDWSAVLNKGFDDFTLSDRGDEDYNLLYNQLRGTNKKAPQRLFASTKARQ